MRIPAEILIALTVALVVSAREVANLLVLVYAHSNSEATP